MNRLFIYFARGFVQIILLVWLALLAFDMAFAFFGEVSDIGRGQYNLASVFQYLALTAPRRAYELFPMAALVGALLSVGVLSAKSELTAARAAGLSHATFIGWVMLVGCLMLVLAMFMGEIVAPTAEQQASSLRTQALFDRVTVQRDKGIWVREGQRYIHIGSVAENGQLQNVQVYEFAQNHQLAMASHINSARYKEGAWSLNRIQQTRFQNQSLQVIEKSLAQWPKLVEPALVRVLAREPQYMTLLELKQYITYLRSNNVDTSRYQLDFWSRLVRPGTVIAMLVLGVGIVLGAQQRSSTGWRLLIGILAGLGFKLLNDLFGQAGLVYGVTPVLSALIPTLIVVSVAAWLLRREG